MNKSLDDYEKEDWMKENMHGPIRHETVIHRIFRVDHLLSDLSRGVNTLVHPCYETQGDDLENPLKLAEFTIDCERHQLFKLLMSEYYAQSWSLTEQPWGVFGDGEDTVRLTSTVGKIFGRLMNESDPFYSLYYHVGLVDYQGAFEIRRSVERDNYEHFIDSRGYRLLETVLKIRAKFRSEQEVRFAYIRSPREGYSYPLRNGVFGEKAQFCSLAFDWGGAIDDFMFAPINRSHHPDLEARLLKVMR